MNENLTEEEIQAQLTSGSVRGPLQFRGKTLAAYTSGLRDIVLKVVRMDDTMAFHDFVLVYVLTEAWSANSEDRLSRRIALMLDTDDVVKFRARVSLEFIDELTDDETAEIRTLANAILEPVIMATVHDVTAQKKSSVESAAKPRRTAKHSS